MKDIKYRDQIIKKKAIYQLLESTSDPLLINIKTIALSHLCYGKPFVKRIFTEPIVKYFFRHIKQKNLNKIGLSKALRAISVYFESIEYRHRLLLEDNNAVAIFEIIEKEMNSDVALSPFKKK